jgi:hypothetical protein
VTTLAQAAITKAYIGSTLVHGAAARTPVIATYAQEVLADTPVGWWRLDETSGTTAADSSGNGRDGTYVNTPTLGASGLLAADPTVGSVRLSELANEYVEIADNNAFSLTTTGELTVEHWYALDAVNFSTTQGSDGGYIHYLGKRDNVAGLGAEWLFRLYQASSATRPQRNSAYHFPESGGLGNGAFIEEPIAIDEVVHLVVTFDVAADQIKLYKNGVLRDTKALLNQTVSLTPSNTAAPVRIGTVDNQTHFHGRIQDVSIYPAALPGERIAAHYLAGAGS